MARIFISYKRVDKEKVFKIKDLIESALGEKCWIDLDGIESDAQFVNVIVRAIDRSEIVLFMYSHQHTLIDDFENDWTIRELDYAQDEKKRIVFVNIDNSPLKGWFKFMYGKKQQIDGCSEDALERLICDMKKWLGIVNVNRPNNASASKNVSFIVENNKIVLEIVDKFSFVLEKDAENKVYIGNIPVREILEYAKTMTGESRTLEYLTGILRNGVIPIYSIFPMLSGIASLYNWYKEHELSKMEVNTFIAILSEINHRYGINLKKLPASMRQNTNIPLTDFAVFLDSSDSGVGNLIAEKLWP